MLDIDNFDFESSGDSFRIYIISLYYIHLQYTYVRTCNLDFCLYIIWTNHKSLLGLPYVHICVLYQLYKHPSRRTSTVLIYPNALIHMRKQHLFKFWAAPTLCKLNQNNVKSALKCSKMKLWLIRFECLCAGVQSKRVTSHPPVSTFLPGSTWQKNVKLYRRMKCLCRVDN